MSEYNQLCTEFYDLDKPSAPEDALSFYLHYARAAQGPIFEPMCGSGRFLLPLMQHGFDIDGSDPSPFMLQACRERARALGLEPQLYAQRLEEAALPRRYALVLIPAGSFALITDPAQIREALRRLYELMLPGAKLVLEVGRPTLTESGSWPWGGRWLKRPDGALMIISWLGHYDASTRVSHNLHRYELIENGRLTETEVSEFHLRLYEPDELEALLRGAGFALIRRLKTFADAPPDESDTESVLECTRP